MQSERTIGQVDAKRSCARARAAQQASNYRFGGELTAHCYRDSGAFAPIPAIYRGGEQSSRSLTNPTFNMG
jgi:hypothetical protein